MLGPEGICNIHRWLRALSIAINRAKQLVLKPHPRQVRILPLHMLERSNRRQMNELFKLLRKNGQATAIVYPELFRHL